MPQRFISLVLSLAILLAQPGPTHITLSQPYPPPPAPPVVVEKPEIEVGQVLKLPVVGKTVTIRAGKTGNNQVALTFDAGWEFDRTEALLKTLKDHDVKATFFLRGGWVRDYPDLVQAITADGHEIGNHSWNHPHMGELGDASATAEIYWTQGAIRAASNRGRTFYRPPFGESDERDLGLLARLGYHFNVLWSVDTRDWMPETSRDDIVAQSRLLKDGGIALMHVGGPNTVAALPAVIEGLRTRGLEPVVLSALVDWTVFPTRDYTVADGDSVDSIAQAFELEPLVIRQLNGIQ